MEFRRRYVRLPDGRDAALFRIAAGDMAVTIAEFGATLLAIETPDRRGRSANVILAYPAPADYPAAGAPGVDARLGASCGRVANRIGGASFVLDGTRFALDPNEGASHLHGGVDGFGRKLWRGERVVDAIEMALKSVDGEGGYPGTLDVRACVTIVDGCELRIDYRARTDRPTHVNIVSHPYFNLSGNGAIRIDDHELMIAADAAVPIDERALPAGPAFAVLGTPFDFRVPRPIGAGIDADDPQIRIADGYNHCFVLRPPDRLGAIRAVASLRSVESGRTMTLLTDQRALQFYSGNALGAENGAPGAVLPFGRRTGLCLEAQAFPDAANHPEFPSTRLDPGETYRSTLRLRFGVDD